MSGWTRWPALEPGMDNTATAEADPVHTVTACTACRTETKRSSGLCRRCDPARREKRQRKQNRPNAATMSVKDLVERINTGVTELVTSDDWQHWLQTSARFHTYSFNNRMLIWIQHPDATRVGGYRMWQQLGRQVRAGETAIKILAPTPVKIVDDETGDETRFTRFRAVNVFDMSQTDGDPLPDRPSINTATGDVPAAMLTDLHRHAAALDADVTFCDTDPMFDTGANGYAQRTHDGRYRIVICDQLTEAQQARVFAHEIGHIALGHLDPAGDWWGGELFTDRHRLRGDLEVEAESFAYLLATSWGLNADNYSFGYIAGWSGGDTGKVRELVDHVTNTVTAFFPTSETVGG